MYVRDTEELHAAVLEELLGTSGLLAIRGDGGRGWRRDIIELLRGYVALLLAYPSVARVTAFTRPVGPNYIQLVERLLALMDRGGVSLGEAAWGVDLLLQQAETTAVEQGMRNPQGQEADDAALRSAIAAIVAANAPGLPHIVAAGEDLISGDGAERGTWAFEVLLNGLLSTPRPETASGWGVAAEPEAPPTPR